VKLRRSHATGRHYGATSAGAPLALAVERDCAILNDRKVVAPRGGSWQATQVIGCSPRSRDFMMRQVAGGLIPALLGCSLSLQNSKMTTSPIPGMGRGDLARHQKKVWLAQLAGVPIAAAAQYGHFAILTVLNPLSAFIGTFRKKDTPMGETS
jgi:hypothetical protein